MREEGNRIYIPSFVDIEALKKSNRFEQHMAYLRDFYNCDAEEWYQGNNNDFHQFRFEEWFAVGKESLNEWYPVKSCIFPDVSPRNPDYNDEGYFDQPPPDIFSKIKCELVREKIEELLHLLFDFSTPLVMESFDRHVRFS
ncbi:MAG: hypothetical protein ACTSQK_03925 [Candidatus Heimdallarchaeota archaeon]